MGKTTILGTTAGRLGMLLVLSALAVGCTLSRGLARDAQAPREALADAVAIDGLLTLDTTLSPVEDPAASERALRETILDMVRKHRRSADEAWHRELCEAILGEAGAADMDPLMVASIVAKESSFKSRIVSRAGAVGLMHFRPFVAQDVARRAELEWNGVTTLHSPELNLRLGIVYYKELLDRFEGDERKALTAYNYGPTRVSRQLRNGTYAGSTYADSILDLHASLSDRTAAL